MIKIEMVLDEINYNDIAELAIPIVKEKLVQKGNVLGLAKHVPESVLNHLAHEFLEKLSNEKKEELAIQLINLYGSDLTNALQKAVADKGIRITIRDMSVQSV